MKRSPARAKKRRSPSPVKKRRSTKRRYRMDGTQRVTVMNPFLRTELVIELPSNATVNVLKDRINELNPIRNDHFIQLFVENPEETDPIVLRNNELVSGYATQDIMFIVSPKAFMVNVRFFTGLTQHGPFHTEEEALRKVWIISNETIERIRNHPIPPYLTEDYLNLRNVKIDNNYQPQSSEELMALLHTIWGDGGFRFDFQRVSTLGRRMCKCNRLH